MDRLPSIGSPLPARQPATSANRPAGSGEAAFLPWLPPADPDPMASLDPTRPADPATQEQLTLHFMSHINAECSSRCSRPWTRYPTTARREPSTGASTGSSTTFSKSLFRRESHRRCPQASTWTIGRSWPRTGIADGTIGPERGQSRNLGFGWPAGERAAAWACDKDRRSNRLIWASDASDRRHGNHASNCRFGGAVCPCGTVPGGRACRRPIGAIDGAIAAGRRRGFMPGGHPGNRPVSGPPSLGPGHPGDIGGYA